MLLLTDAGVSQSADVGTEMIAGGAVPKLTNLLSSNESMIQEMAAAVLGNLCHESPENQEKLLGVDDLTHTSFCCPWLFYMLVFQVQNIFLEMKISSSRCG